MTAIATLEARSDFTGRCTRCSQCKFVAAPASHRHASACPSIDYGEHHAYSGGGQVIMAHGLVDGTLSPTPAMIDAVASCTMCGACDVACKVNFGEVVEPLDSLYALRAKLVDLGAAPSSWRAIVDALEHTGNPHGRPRAERARWADCLGLPATAAGDAGVMLHIGSTLSHASHHADALRTIVGALGAAGVPLCYARAAEGSSGATAWDLGHVEAARRLAQATVERVTASGATTLVTFSAAAYAAFRAIYPRLGVGFDAVRILHITQFVAELADAGALAIARSPAAGTMTYHDPCRLGRLSEPWTFTDTTLDKRGGLFCSREPKALRFGNGGCYDAPRSLLRRMGFDLTEMERNRASSYCCGAAGGVPATQPDAAALAARNRMDEARASGAAAIVSGCSGCTAHLDAHAEGDLPVRDLIELIALALRPTR